MATNINNRLVCNEPHANLDSYYGPYDSVDAAFNALADTTVNGVNYTKKYIGLTVGVWNSAKTEITEYWFKGGTAKANLVVKTDGSGGGLPSGIKIVTFDKNGGSGVQNSILTDTTSQVVLPECTFTKTGETFSCWKYNGTQKNPGQTITVGSTTVVQAQWSSSPTPKPSHVITWSAGTGINKITGTANGVAISSGALVQEGSTIVLTATPNSGYNFSQWSGLPSGTSSNNPVTFTMGTSDITVTATGSAATQYYTVSWSAGTHITSITGKYNGDNPITSGRTQIPAGSTVTLTANVETGCQFSSWSNLPSGVSATSNPVSFTLNNNLRGVSATAEQVAQEFMLSFKTEGEGVEDVKGLVDGEEASSGSVYPENSRVELTATFTEGYSPVWEGLPDYAVLQADDTIASFLLKESLDIIVKASEGPGPVEDGFNYCLLTYEGNRRGGEAIDEDPVEGNGDDKNMKWFETVEELRKSEGSTVEIEENNSNYLYVIRNSNINPIISLADGEKTYSFIPLNECEDPDIIQYFVEQQQWVESSRNQTKGTLKQYGNFIFIYTDTNSELKGQNIIISIGG